jgi:pyruvate/2-oxoglutarate dehydrogenase complex dihydrolipoamide dehydrogenase (E3) component
MRGSFESWIDQVGEWVRIWRFLQMPKKIAVLGSGANGASIGADLTKAGHDVVLIDQWPEHVQAMRMRGIRIEMPNMTLAVC